MDDLTTKFPANSGSLQDRINRARTELAALRREKKANDLAQARAQRKAAGIAEASHHKAKPAEPEEGVDQLLPPSSDTW